MALPDTAKPATAAAVNRLQDDRLAGAIEQTDKVLAPATQDIAALTARAAKRFRQWQRRTVSEAIDIGTDLLRVKQALGHGHFIAWLRTEFPTEIRTAQRLMQVAVRFAGKNDRLSHLPLSGVYLLAAPSTPETIIGEVSSKIARGEVVDIETVKAKIDLARSEARQAKRKDKLSDRTKKRHEIERTKREERQKRDREQGDASAQEILAEFGLDTVRRILKALEDYNTESAIRRIIIDGSGA
jgi:hypothetical protein